MQELEEELKNANDTIDKLQKIKSSESELENELNDVKNKLRLITTKFANVRKERDGLKKENRMLQNEILELQSNMRHMVPGYQNISVAFPMINEISDSIHQFYKCDCQDIFFEILGPELSIEGIAYFFKFSFSRINDLVHSYFHPVEETIARVTSLESLEGPIMNVLRKSYQASWKKILKNSVPIYSLQRIMEDVLKVLRLNIASSSVNKQIMNYVQKLVELMLVFYINDPPIKIITETIGQQVEFNSLHHDAIDGFIRSGDRCILILPSTFKNAGELLTRAAVLHVDYEMNF